MKKIVVITYYWPPAGGPGVQRWLKFTKFLRGYGYDPLVIVPENPTYPLKDPSLSEEIPPGISVKRVPIKEPYNLARKFSAKETRALSRGIIEQKSPSLMQRLLLYIRGNFFIPDARVGWVKPVVKEAGEILQSQGIETVITTGPPHSVHLIGKRLKELFEIHWIADFRDPWTTIGYHEQLRLGKRASKKHRQLESDVLQQADQLIVTSYTTKEEFGSKTSTPVHLITNGYDVAIAEGEELDKKFSISHIGSMLSGRNPEVLWKVLSELVQTEPGIKDDLVINLIGATSNDVLSSIEDFGLGAHVHAEGYMDHNEAIRVQRRSQLLLLAEIDSENSRAIIPGKLFEYLAAKRPILAVGPDNWDAAKIILDHQAGAVFGYDEHTEMKDRIRQWYRDYQSGKLVSESREIEKFNRKSLTARLAEILPD